MQIMDPIPTGNVDVNKVYESPAMMAQVDYEEAIKVSASTRAYFAAHLGHVERGRYRGRMRPRSKENLARIPDYHTKVSFNPSTPELALVSGILHHIRAGLERLELEDNANPIFSRFESQRAPIEERDLIFPYHHGVLDVFLNTALDYPNLLPVMTALYDIGALQGTSSAVALGSDMLYHYAVDSNPKGHGSSLKFNLDWEAFSNAHDRNGDGVPEDEVMCLGRNQARIIMRCTKVAVDLAKAKYPAWVQPTIQDSGDSFPHQHMIQLIAELNTEAAAYLRVNKFTDVAEQRTQLRLFLVKSLFGRQSRAKLALNNQTQFEEIQAEFANLRYMEPNHNRDWNYLSFLANYDLSRFMQV